MQGSIPQPTDCQPPFQPAELRGILPKIEQIKLINKKLNFIVYFERKYII